MQQLSIASHKEYIKKWTKTNTFTKIPSSFKLGLDRKNLGEKSGLMCWRVEHNHGHLQKIVKVERDTTITTFIGEFKICQSSDNYLKQINAKLVLVFISAQIHIQTIPTKHPEESQEF